MAYDGTLKFDTALDTSEFQKDTTRLGDIVKGLAVFKILEKGFQAVTASIDQAVSRYDTLNKFPKVLENMGFSAEASAAATEKLADGVHGLPTSLDEIVASAQRLTILTGNLEDSTDTALALNNAFLSSGSSAAEAERGLTQYVQMLSKGEVDVVSWRTLQETMGYALNETAKAFGFAGQSAQNDLYAALKNGDITFAEFNAKIIELNQAVGGFADMAKTSTGGIGTAFTNMKTRIASGVAEIVAGIDRGLSETRFKSIENIINSTGNIIMGTLKNVAGVFEFVASKADLLVPAIIAVVAATGAYKIATAAATAAAAAAGVVIDGNITKENLAAISTGLLTKAKETLTVATGSATTALAMLTAGEATASEVGALLTVKEAALAAIKGVLTGQIGLATAAQLIWNAALAANPIGVVIAAITVLIAGIVALVSWLGKSDSAFNKGKRYIDDYGKANDALAESLDESTSNFNKNRNAATAAASTSKQMLSGLRELADKGLNRTAKETYQLQAKIDALNSVQKGLNLTINEATGELSMTNEEIESYIAATESAARTTALEDHMKALNEQLVDVESQFIDAERQMAEWEKQVENGELSTLKYGKLVVDISGEMSKLQETQSGILEEMRVNEEEYSEMLAQQEQQRQALLDLQEDEIRDFAAQHHLSYDEIRADMDENNLSFAEWQEKNKEELDKSKESIAEFAEKWGYSVDEVDAAITASGLTVGAYVEQQEEALKHAQDVISEFTAAATNGFSVMEQESAISLNKFMENMKKNASATANWAENMNTLMDLGINQGVIAQLAQMGPEGAIQAQAFVDELTKLNGGVDVALGATNETVAAKLEEIDSTFNTGLEATNAAADAQLRAESYYEAGYASIDKIATGIAENPSAVNAAAKAGTDIGESITTSVEAVDFSTAGQNVGNGIVSGLAKAVQSGSGKVSSAVSGVGASVQSEFRTMSNQAKTTASQMMSDVNNAIVSRASTIKGSIANIGNGITSALNSAKTQAVNSAAQMMSGIHSAIVSHTGAIRSSAASVVNAITSALNDMTIKGHEIASRMMTDINSAIVSRTSTIRASATAAANSVVSGLQAMVSGAENVASNMMDGIGAAMDRKAPSLYAKAREIANRIASIMADALDVHSPSRVMIRLFENVMLGIYEGMDGMSGMLYREAESIADGIADRLTISKDVANALVEQMRTITNSTPLGGAALVPQAAAVGAGGGARYVTSLTQNITTPKPLSASEMTREGQDLLRRQRWQLP